MGSGWSHTKNQKNRWAGCRNVLENAYFSHLFRHFRRKKNFSCKTAYAIFKVVYQAGHIPKIRKIYGVVAKKWSKMHIFHTFFAIFGQKIFFSKIRLRQFFGTIKSYLDAKNQKKLWSRSSGIHPYGRTDVRTHESKSIVPPKFFGSVPH